MAEGAGRTERFRFCRVRDGHVGKRRTDCGPNLIRCVTRQECGLAKAGTAQLIEQVREKRPPSYGRKHLGPVRDDAAKPRTEPTSQDRRGNKNALRCHIGNVVTAPNVAVRPRTGIQSYHQFGRHL